MPESRKNELPLEFVSAVKAEYGLSPQRIIDLIQFLEEDALSRDELIVITSVDAFKKTLHTGKFAVQEIEAVLTAFTLCPRPAWDLAPQGFRNEDWYPWRFSRRLSLFSRPLIVCGNKSADTLIYAPGFVGDAVRAMLTRSYSAVFPKEYYRSREMQTWADAQTLRQGTDFEVKVKDELSSLGWLARQNVKMTELGADKSYGNIDVLAWNNETGTILVTECKRLRQARTVSEVCEKLRNFRGEEQDDLHSHIRRFKWLVSNRKQLSRVTKIPEAEQRFVPLLVKNAIVPMQFVRDLPLPAELIVPVKQLKSNLPRVVERTWKIP